MQLAKPRIRPVVQWLSPEHYLVRAINKARKGGSYPPLELPPTSNRVFPDNGRGGTNTYRESRGDSYRANGGKIGSHTRDIDNEAPSNSFNETTERKPPSQKVGWLGKIKGLFRRKRGG